MKKVTCTNQGAVYAWLHSATMNRQAILISLLKTYTVGRAQFWRDSAGAVIVEGIRASDQRHHGMMQARITPGAGREVRVNGGGEHTPGVESRGGEAEPVKQRESRRQWSCLREER